MLMSIMLYISLLINKVGRVDTLSPKMTKTLIYHAPKERMDDRLKFTVQTNLQYNLANFGSILNEIKTEPIDVIPMVKYNLRLSYYTLRNNLKFYGGVNTDFGSFTYYGGIRVKVK